MDKEKINQLRLEGVENRMRNYLSVTVTILYYLNEYFTLTSSSTKKSLYVIIRENYSAMREAYRHMTELAIYVKHEELQNELHALEPLLEVVNRFVTKQRNKLVLNKTREWLQEHGGRQNEIIENIILFSRKARSK